MSLVLAKVSVCKFRSLTIEAVEASMATRRAKAIIDEVVPFFQKSILRGKVVIFDGCSIPKFVY
jgi:hypothetical protein